MIIVDYADLLKPLVVRKEKRNELESIYEELRAISQEFGCPIVTASQTNRKGLNEEVITMESISEAFNPSAAYGGFIGALVTGIKRGVFSNEGGVGSASIAF